MRGPHDAALRLVAHHHRHLVAAARAVEAAGGFAPGELGVPGFITASDPGQIGSEWHPAIVVSVLDTAGTEVEDVEGYGHHETGPDGTLSSYGPRLSFSVTYRVRHDVVLSAHDLPTADRWRYGWLTAIRTSLMLHGALDDEHAALAPATILKTFREVYDAPAAVDARGWAQGLIEHPLQVTETLTGAPGDPITGLRVGADPVAEREPFPSRIPHPSD